MSASLLPARMHSSPNMPSTGRALNWVTSGQPLHPGLVALPGSGAVLETPGAAPWGAASSSLAGGTGGHVVERGSDVTASFIPLRSELAGDPAQNFTERLECLRSVGLRHAQQFGGVHAQVSEQASRVSGEVCRDCGC
jgi:hypothetical protein